ncbi:DUF7695 domain-containing protein [Paenibacillus glycinis]
MRSRIIRNEIRCKHCLVDIISMDIHDMKFCDCGKVGVDGGRDYLKRFGLPEDFDEKSILVLSEEEW